MEEVKEPTPTPTPKKILTPAMRESLIELLRRKTEEPIRFFKANPGAQQTFFDLLKTKREVAYFAGNKSGKTYCGAKHIIQAALWSGVGKYNLEVLYDQPIDIWVGSVDYKTQRESAQKCIEDLLPRQEIKKIHRLQNDIIDRIDLMGGSTIGFKTYDQGRKAWQGPVKTIVWFDEEPPEEIIKEGMARLTAPNAKMIFTMTPLMGMTTTYKMFVDGAKKFLYRGYVFGSTYENKEHLSAEYLESMEGMDEKDKQQRLQGRFIQLSGLVYSEFDRDVHVIPHFDPDPRTYIFLGGMDFGADHPTGFVAAGVDMAGNVYVWAEYKQANAGFREHAEGWHAMIGGKDIKRVFRDPSAAQAGIEFARMKPHSLRIRTSPGVNDRTTGISLVNGLFRDRRLFISSRLIELIYELEHHKYKRNTMKDGDVEKTDDDLCDALRYLISSAIKIIHRPKNLRDQMLGLPSLATNGVNW